MYKKYKKINTKNIDILLKKVYIIYKIYTLIDIMLILWYNIIVYKGGGYYENKC